jgi:hypothetical protein
MIPQVLLIYSIILHERGMDYKRFSASSDNHHLPLTLKSQQDKTILIILPGGANHS